MEGISDYEFNSKDLIGHGAFAIVYRGRHKQKPGLTVAIKSITKKNIAKSQNLLSKEIKILKELTELHHENVVALLDCKETQTHVYLVMEYCNGGDLADYLHSKGTLSEDTIRLFLKQLAGAMKALFGKGIVHRDLKPQNILLSNGGKTNPAPQHITLKIADFGFARFLQDGVMAATLCGSPMYMAPEVIMSLQYDAKADLWSLGTIVFQCLAGKAPFQANTPQALKQYYEKNANLAPRIPSGTSPELTDLLLGLLKRNARDRMEFETFFNHPFIRTVTGTINTTHSNTQAQQQQIVPSAAAAAVGGGAVANPRTNPLPVPNPRPAPTQPTTKHIRGGNYNYTDNLPPPSPPPGHLPPTPEELRMSVDQKSDTVVPPSPLPTTRPSPVPRPMSAADDTEDFVMVPASIPMEADGPRGSSRGSGKVMVGGGGVAYQKGHHHHYTAHTPQVQASPRPSNLPVQGQSGGVLGSSNSTSSSESYRSGEPIPVPSQRATYQQMTGSSCSSDNLPSSGAPESPQRICQGVGMGGGAPGNPLHQSPGSNPPALHSSPSPPLRSQPIAVRRVSDTRAPDVASLSPPSVQFTIGTPPLSSRRRSTSGSSYSTTPPTGKGQMIAGGRMTPTSHNSPLRQSGRNTPPHLPPAVYAAVLPPILGSPTKHSAVVMGQGEYDNSAGDICGNPPLAAGTCPQHLTSNSPPFTTGPPNRAITLPEMTSAARDLYSGQGTDMSVEGGGALQRSRTESYLLDSLLRGGTTIGGSPPNPGHLLQYGQSAPAFLFPGALQGGSDFLLGSGGSGEGGETGAITFYAPPLHQETLMEKEHNETLAKLNFVLALVDCILELARSRATPITALRESTYRTHRDNAGDKAILPITSEAQRRAEQLVLYVRALQLLSSALSLAKEEKNKGRLQPSTAVKTVVGVLNERFRQALTVCKDLNSSGAVTAVDPKTSTVTADKLIYNYAIDMCQSAALDELFGKPEECFRRYQTAQILLHSLAQQVAHESDRTLLTRYKQAVEKRLYLLHEQGLVQMVSTDTA